MKRIGAMVLAILGTALCAGAEEYERPRRDGPPPWMADGDRAPGERMDRRGFGPPPSGRGDHPFLDRWLRHRQETDPEEYDRLMELKEDDPKAFRKEMRKRLKEMRSRRGGDRGPGEAAQGEDKGPEGFGNRFPRSPEAREAHDQAVRLSREYRAAGEEDRAALKEAMREQVGYLFDLKQQEHRQKLERLKRHLENLQNKVEKQEANREKMIDRRLESLIRDRSLKP